MLLTASLGLTCLLAPALALLSETPHHCHAPTHGLTCYGLICSRSFAYTGVCATLVLTDETGNAITWVEGTDPRVVARATGRAGVRAVAGAHQHGIGCYKIFKGSRFRGETIVLTSNRLVNLRQHGFNPTKIQSIKYDINCIFD